MTEAINIDDMIHFENRNDSHIFDRSYYQIYIKCGDLKKNIYIHGAEEEYYKPFIWLLELFNDVSRQIPFEMSDKHGNWVDVHKYNLENNPEMFNDKD